MKEEKQKKFQAAKLGQKKEYEMKSNEYGKPSFRHPAEATLIGSCLMSFSLGLQNGAFLGIYIIGLVLSVIDLPRLLGREQSLASKVLSSHTTYYAAGGVGASMFFMSIGYPVPQPEFGLLAEAAAGIMELIL